MQRSRFGAEVLDAESNQFIKGNHSTLIQAVPAGGSLVLDTGVAYRIVDGMQAVLAGIRVNQVHLEAKSAANQHYHDAVVLSSQLLCGTTLH